MAKQYTEKKIRETLQHYQKTRKLWFTKLQANPFSFTKTPFDYIILTEKKTIALESKERKLPYNKINFNELAFQEKALMEFVSINENNKAYFLFHFKQPMRKSNFVFLVEIRDFVKKKEELQQNEHKKRKSIAISDLLRMNCQMDYLSEGKYLNFEKWLF